MLPQDINFFDLLFLLSSKDRLSSSWQQNQNDPNPFIDFQDKQLVCFFPEFGVFTRKLDQNKDTSWIRVLLHRGLKQRYSFIFQNRSRIRLLSMSFSN